jgi:hypothetical protein
MLTAFLAVEKAELFSQQKCMGIFIISPFLVLMGWGAGESQGEISQ